MPAPDARSTAPAPHPIRHASSSPHRQTHGNGCVTEILGEAGPRSSPWLGPERRTGLVPPSRRRSPYRLGGRAAGG